MILTKNSKIEKKGKKKKRNDTNFDKLSYLFSDTTRMYRHYLIGTRRMCMLIFHYTYYFSIYFHYYRIYLLSISLKKMFLCELVWSMRCKRY